MEWATIAVGDKIEVNLNNAWVPAVIRKVFPDRELGFFTAELSNPLRMMQIMVNKRKINWRHLDAAVSA